MTKKTCWILIFITLAANVVFLSKTIESYFGQEYDHVFAYTAAALVSSIICFAVFLRWRKLEYGTQRKK